VPSLPSFIIIIIITIVIIMIFIIIIIIIIIITVVSCCHRHGCCHIIITVGTSLSPGSGTAVARPCGRSRVGTGPPSVTLCAGTTSCTHAVRLARYGVMMMMMMMMIHPSLPPYPSPSPSPSACGTSTPASVWGPLTCSLCCAAVANSR